MFVRALDSSTASILPNAMSTSKGNCPPELLQLGFSLGSIREHARNHADRVCQVALGGVVRRGRALPAVFIVLQSRFRTRGPVLDEDAGIRLYRSLRPHEAHYGLLLLHANIYS